MNKTRRQFVTGLGKGALATAFFNAPFWARNVFAQTPNKKAVFIYQPDGCTPSLWHPTETGTTFTLPTQTSTLEPVKQHCVFIQGLEMLTEPNGHQGQPEILTADHSFSIDQLISRELGASYPFKGIHLGVGSNFKSKGALSYLPGQIPISPNDDPINSFDSVFGVSQNATERQRLASILSTAKTEITRLRNRLGVDEREKLSQHEESIFQVEQRLNDFRALSCNTSSWNSQGFATDPRHLFPLTYYRDEYFDTVAKLQIDLIVLALKCGMTPVATLCFSHPVCPFKLPGETENHHQSSHNGRNLNSPSALLFARYKQYWCGLLRYFIEQLNQVTDTDGSSLLHNTLIFMGSELSDSDGHNQRNMPFILAGNAGGALVTGRSLAYPAATSHSKLLVSIANMMGIAIDNFGDGLSGPGGLSGL